VLLSLLAQADDPMLLAEAPSVLGEDPRVTSVNEAFCRLSGHAAEEVTGRGWLTICGERADASVIDRIKRACYQREHLALELPLARADGLEVLTRCELLPLREGGRDARAGASRVLIIQRDISEHRQTHDMLKSLRAMTRRASHEVNNGLASVIINLSLASSARAPKEEQQERIQDALNAAREAAEIAKRLSALAGNLEPPPAFPTPRTEPSAEHGAMRFPAPADAPGVPIGSLLILDDDEAVAELLATILGHAGYRVASARDPDRCVELYREAFTAGQPFDLVILDLSIGRGRRRGLSTLMTLQAIDPQIKAVAHSGYSNDDVMLHPREFGFVAAIQKPTAPSEMVRVLADLIRIHAR